MLKDRFKPIFVDLDTGKWYVTTLTNDSNLKTLRVEVRDSAESWYVRHNRKTNKIFFQILDNSGTEIIPQEIEIIDINTVQITFFEKTSGTLHLIFHEIDFYDV
jgi:hypothetical protein